MDHYTAGRFHRSRFSDFFSQSSFTPGFARNPDPWPLAPGPRYGSSTTLDRQTAKLEGVWEYQPGVSPRTMDVHVAWLRQKLEDNPQTPRHIHTVRGVGHRFSA
jgi:hypothetical protein